MSVNEAKAKFVEAKKAVENCTKLLSDLTKRYDDLQESLPRLKDGVEIAEKSETTAYDSHVLGKISAKDLEKVKSECQTVKNQYAESSKMLESLGRGITGKEREIAGLRKEMDSLRHQVWSSLFEAKVAAIPETVQAVVKELICIGLNCSMGRDFILPKIFSLPTNTEIQNIYKKLSLDLGME